MSEYIPWTRKDYELRELLRSAKSIEELFRAYQQNAHYIRANRPELAKFALRCFWLNFCEVFNFVYLARAKDATQGLPADDPVWSEIRLTMLDQVGISSFPV